MCFQQIHQRNIFLHQFAEITDITVFLNYLQFIDFITLDLGDDLHVALHCNGFCVSEYSLIVDKIQLKYIEITIYLEKVAIFYC